MMAKLTTNWHLKLLSIGLAFILWVVVINYDDPEISKSFEDVPVMKMNENAITSQDKAVDYLDGETVDVVLEGRRSIIDKLTVSDINAYADMTRVSVTNAIIISIEVDEDVTLVKKVPNEMLISMEDIRSELKTVQVRFEGDLAQDYVKLNEIVTPNQIQITGPESKLALVSSVIVPIKIDEAFDDVTVFVAPRLLDSSGNELRDLQVSEDQIQVKVPVQKIKTVPVKVATLGELNENYRLMSVGLSIDSVTIRGEEGALEDVASILVDDVDLSNLTDADTEKNVKLTDYLPEDVLPYKTSDNQQVLLSILPIINATRVVEQADVNVRLIPDGLQFQFVEEDPYPIGIRGIYKDLQAVDVEDLRPKISLDGLEPGIHQVFLEVTSPMNIVVTNEAMPLVTIELTENNVVEGTTAEESTTASQ